MLTRGVRNGALLSTAIGSTAIGSIAIGVALAMLGCGGGNGNRPSSCQAARGIVLLSWTVRGQPATADSCKGIDHLILQMQTGCGGLEIEPILCIQGAHWEYDDLPAGNAGVLLDAVDARGATLLQGSGVTTVSATKPSLPSAIDLQ